MTTLADMAVRGAFVIEAQAATSNEVAFDLAGPDRKNDIAASLMSWALAQRIGPA
jgi:hypothetical protein